MRLFAVAEWCVKDPTIILIDAYGNSRVRPTRTGTSFPGLRLWRNGSDFVIWLRHQKPRRALLPTGLLWGRPLQMEVMRALEGLMKSGSIPFSQTGIGSARRGADYGRPGT